MDEMQFKYDAAKEQMKAAKEIYQMAIDGARHEDIKMAQGKYLQAQGVFQEAEHFYEQTIIRAPISGEINAKLSEEGEVMAAGFPIMSIQDLSKIHAVINVREDLLPNFKKGKIVTAKIAALGNEEFKFKVTFLAPLADFANWLPTKDKGEFDLKTFEVKLEPVDKIKDLRPGMTIQIYLS
jgi:HlyD family secretion protein